jgi:hypothetical protein
MLTQRFPAFTQRTTDNRFCHHPAPVDPFATLRLALPGRGTANHLRPKRVGSALRGTSSIHPAPVIWPQKYTALPCTGCQHQFTVIQSPQISPPKPVTRQLQMRTNRFRLTVCQIDIVLTGCSTALATLCTGKSQWLSHVKWLH